jgi:hypothetical protein
VLLAERLEDDDLSVETLGQLLHRRHSASSADR